MVASSIACDASVMTLSPSPSLFLGMPDDQVLAKADTAGFLLLTADKDFGELVYRRQMAHCGVMLLRQSGLPIDVRAEVVLAVLASHASELAAAFTVIAPESVRIRRPPHAEA